MSDAPNFPATGLYLDDLVSTGKPSLGDLQTVTWLVRHFSKFVLDARAAWHAGAQDAKDPLAAIEEEARLYGRIFLGQDERFDAQPWNSPRRLGMTLTMLVPEETKHYGDPGAALFMWLAAQTSEAARTLEDGEAEASVQERLARVCDDVVERLLGVKY